MVAATALMAMSVVMIMLVAVFMPVMMPVLVIMGVMVILPVVMPVAAIRAMDMGFLFRRKSVRDRCHGHADAAQHFLDIRIAADQKGIVGNFHQCMIGAEIPGRTHEPCGIVAGDLRQFFLRCTDQHEIAILQLECIAITHRRGLRQINIEMQAFFTVQMQVR